MPYHTGHYNHPQGARLTMVRLTCWEPVLADHTAEAWYRPRSGAAPVKLGNIVIKAGESSGELVDGLGQEMSPLDSTVWVISSQAKPDGIMAVASFNQGT